MSDEWIKGWIAARTEHTRRAYVKIFADFEKWSGKQCWKSSRKEVLAFADHLRVSGKAEASIRRDVAAMNSLLNSIDEVQSPRRSIKQKSAKVAEADHPSPYQIEGILRSRMNPQFRLAWFLCWRIGLKTNEAVSVRWSDVDLDSGIMRVGKRIISLSPHCVDFLSSFTPHSGTLLVGRGEKLNVVQLVRRIGKLGACIGRPRITPKDLRSAHAYWAANGAFPCSPALIARTLGISLHQLARIAFREFDDLDSRCFYLDQIVGGDLT